MVKVEFYQTASMRKSKTMKEGEIRGVFFVNILPKEIPEVPEVDTKLRGQAKKAAVQKREELVRQRNLDVAQAILDCKFAACDKVREVTGPDGVLVASIPQEQ